MSAHAARLFRIPTYDPQGRRVRGGPCLPQPRLSPGDPGSTGSMHAAGRNAGLLPRRTGARRSVGTRLLPPRLCTGLLTRGPSRRVGSYADLGVFGADSAEARMRRSIIGAKAVQCRGRQNRRSGRSTEPKTPQMRRSPCDLLLRNVRSPDRPNPLALGPQKPTQRLALMCRLSKTVGAARQATIRPARRQLTKPIAAQRM